MVAVERELPSVASPSSADAIPLALRRRGGTARQVLAIVVVGTLVLALFASSDLSSWLYRLGGGPLLVPLQHAADQWNGMMDRIGLTGPNRILRAAIGRARDAEWPERD